MTDKSSIVLPGDFDLAEVDSAGGWWIGANQSPDHLLGGFVGENFWQDRLTKWAEFSAMDPLPEPVLASFDQRAASLAEAALSFRHRIIQRLSEDNPYPDGQLPMVNLVGCLRHFLDCCVSEQFQQLRALIPDPVACGGLQAYGRDSVLLVIPSNVLVAGLEAIQQALLAGCRRVLVRLPRAGASVIVDYCRTLALTSPELGRRLILMRWPSTAHWPSVLRDYPVVAFGGEDSLRTIRAQTRGDSLQVHGHQVGVALSVGMPRPDEVQGLASSVLAHEQRGCLSPRLVLAAGLDRRALKDLAKDLAAALDPAPSQDGWCPGYPVGTNLAEQSTVAQRRTDLCLMLTSGEGISNTEQEELEPAFGLEVSPGGLGSVEWHWAPPSGLDKSDLDRINKGLESALGRHLVLVGLNHDQPAGAFRTFSQPDGLVRDIAREIAGLLKGQPISILGCTDAARDLARCLARIWPTLSPANRPIPMITPVHAMQSPPLNQPLDGRPPLWDFIHFVQDRLD